MNCPICQLKFKSEKSYINHLEKKHKEEDDCGCDGVSEGGGGGGESMSQLEKSIERAKKKVEEAEKSINMNALEFGL